jgi:hypothetical protein
MPVTFAFMRALDAEYLRLDAKVRELGPRNGEIPVGGGDWMDSFFRAEAIRGTLGALRRGTGLKDALIEGEDTAKVAIAIWNRKREYQVRRDDCWVGDYLRGVVIKVRAVRGRGNR